MDLFGSHQGPTLLNILHLGPIYKLVLKREKCFHSTIFGQSFRTPHSRVLFFFNSVVSDGLVILMNMLHDLNRPWWLSGIFRHVSNSSRDRGLGTRFESPTRCMDEFIELLFRRNLVRPSAS